MAYIPIAEAYRLLNESELVDGAKREWKVGDRVEWDDSKNVRRCGFAGMCAGEIVELGADGVGAFARVRLSPGVEAKSRGATWHVDSELLRPVSSPPAIAEKDRLHATGCILCGDPTQFQRSDGPHLGVRYCGACRGPGPAHVDAEITRRKQLAANTQPPAIDWTKTCCQCGNPRESHRPDCSYHKAKTPKPDPYAVHRLKHDDAYAAAMTAKRDLRDTDKQRQAFRELDRAATRKYPYCESSVVFSSATWESY